MNRRKKDEHKHFWLCACGAKNPGVRTHCRRCGCVSGVNKSTVPPYLGLDDETHRTFEIGLHALLVCVAWYRLMRDPALVSPDDVVSKAHAHADALMDRLNRPIFEIMKVLNKNTSQQHIDCECRFWARVGKKEDFNPRVHHPRCPKNRQDDPPHHRLEPEQTMDFITWSLGKVVPKNAKLCPRCIGYKYEDNGKNIRCSRCFGRGIISIRRK